MILKNLQARELARDTKFALVIEQVQQLGVVRAVEAAELGARLLGHRALDVDRVDVVWVARGRAQRATACEEC